MRQTHKDIDWEYMVESITQKRYATKSNVLHYSSLKDIAEDEVVYFMEHEEDSLRDMRKRIAFRYRHNLTYIMEHMQDSIWHDWRSNSSDFIDSYERNLKWGKRFNKMMARW